MAGKSLAKKKQDKSESPKDNLPGKDKSKSAKPPTDEPADDSSDKSTEQSQEKPEGKGDMAPAGQPTGDESVGNVPAVKGQSSRSLDTELMDNIYTGTAEKLFTESSMHPDSMRRPYNPDPLVMKDWTYRIYEEMLEDDQINVALQIKKDLVVGSGFYFETQDEAHADIKDDLEIAFDEDTDRPFSEILVDMIQSYEYGFSVSEKIFKNRADGSLTLKDCKPRHPASWLLHTDPQGNVKQFEQRGLHTNVDADPNSIIHYVNNSKHQNPYGRSDLFPAFQAYMTKRHITRFYAIFMEKAASPTPVGKYDRRADQTAVNDMFEILKKFQTRTAIVIPKEFEVEFLEAKNTGEAFIKGINLFNMFIGRALFIPDLIGFQGSETGGGSFALGKDQIALFFRHIYRRREILERIVNMHFVRPMCMYNHGLTEKFPKFKFNPLSDEDATKQCELWIKAMQGKTWKPTPEEVNHFRGLIKFPQSDVVELVEAAVPGGFDENGKPLPPGGGAPGEAKPGDPAAGSGDLPKEGKNGPESGKPGEEKPPGKDKGKETAPSAEPEVKKKFEIDLSKLKGSYGKKVNFQAADNVLKSTVSKILIESKPIVEDIFEDLYDQIQKKKIIQNQNLDRAESINLKYLKRLQLVFKKNFRHVYRDGQSSAVAEISHAKHEAGADHEVFATNVPSDKFLEFLDQETFKYIGDWAYTVTRKAKDELVKAIKDGRPLSEVINVMDDEGQNLSDVSLERFARTKTTEVFNRGRMEHFDSTGIVAAYQYSAILDDRTSDICAGLDGCIFEKEAAPVPPLHFNCRSLLVPITKYEDYQADTESNNGDKIGDFIEENIGKGFPIN